MKTRHQINDEAKKKTKAALATGPKTVAEIATVTGLSEGMVKVGLNLLFNDDDAQLSARTWSKK